MYFIFVPTLNIYVPGSIKMSWVKIVQTRKYLERLVEHSLICWIIVLLEKLTTKHKKFVKSTIENIQLRSLHTSLECVVQSF